MQAPAAALKAQDRNTDARNLQSAAGAPIGTDDAAVGAMLVERARALVPALRERAHAAEQARCVPQTTIDDFHAAGLFRFLQPKRFGGFELDYGFQVELGAELGRGCGSSAWVLTVLASHHWMLGMYPAEAQEEVWGPSTDTLIVSALNAERSHVEIVDGGYRLSGHWKFASGVAHCAWAMVAAPIHRPEGPPDARTFLLPIGDCTVLDTWFAAGLKGTGSNDIVVDDVFVPEHRTLPLGALKGQPTPGSAVNGSHIYRLPLYAVFPFNIFAPAVGIARGAVEAFVERTSGLVAVTSGLKVAELTNVQARISEAAVEIDCAEMLARRDREEINAIARAGDVPTIEQKVRYRRDISYAATLCLRAVDRVIAVAGAHGLQEDTVEQRAFRDIRAVNQQIALMWDVNALPFARVALGLDAGDRRL